MVFAIVLAAGRSERYGADKLTLDLAGKPVWRWSFDTLLNHPMVDGVGLVTSRFREDAMRLSAPEAAFVVAGGSTRAESCKRGVLATPEACETILLQDAARPLISDRMIEDVIVGARIHGACAPALAVSDTIKRSSLSGFETVDRSDLFAVQTPQGIRRDWLLEAHSLGLETATDDLALVEALGKRPHLVTGDPRALKLTRPEDLRLLEAFLPMLETRTGLGYDIHRFSDDPSRPLMLGGLQFEGHAALDGHSDADVVLHAATDALLGAAGLDDIGKHFPNTDPQWRNQDSSRFLLEAKVLLEAKGWRMVNMDVTIIAETPKILGRRAEMAARIATILGVDSDRVNIKATTQERLGALGRGEGIAAYAIATLTRHAKEN